jgi:thymidylate kinase
MVIILEGQDRTSKSSIARLIQDRLYSSELKPVICSHYTNIHAPQCAMRQISEAHYEGGFKLIKDSINERHLIFDRFHLGEYVYSPLYRNYDGSYVFDIERKYKDFLSPVYLITLTDLPENLIKRDDGLSLSNRADDLAMERKRFTEAHNLSIIPNKLHVDINGIDEKSVQNKIISFIFDKQTWDLTDADEQDDIDDND